MSCCPPAPPIKVSSALGFQDAGQESAMQKGESLECYAARSGNQTGKLDDATGNAPDRIANNSIPIKTSNVSVDVTFKLTTGSTRTATSWKMKVNGVEVTTLGGLTSFNTSTGQLSGTFDSADYGKPFEVLIEAYDATLIDSRTFKFSPSKESNTNSIKLVSPLPGGIVNSKFGLRVHPITKVEKLHSGIDMKMQNRSTVDVVAAADGEVIFAGVNGTLSSGYGNCIKIKHTNGSGQALCTTTYAHLAKIYVAVGQKVAAGQKIGHEGTTGSSTGNHLHFECRLPNNAPVDPVPYIRADLGVADETTDDGEPIGITPVTATGAAITPEGVAAQTTACPPNGFNTETGTQTSPPPDYTPPAVPATDPFEAAWKFTMSFEVGPHWETQPQYSPGDPELEAGLIETDVQRKKVGYKPGPNYPGGETKFGVAQNPNKGTVVVRDLTYSKAKSFGKTNYWDLSGPTNCESKPNLIGIMLFDINYLHGRGNAARILSTANLTGTYTTQAEQLAACELLTKSCLTFIAGLDPRYQNGWIRRTNDRLSYVKSLPASLA